MAQIRILGPVLYGVVAGRLIEVERIDPAIATAVLELLGHSPTVAILVANHALDGAAARRLGTEYGLLTTGREEVMSDEVVR